MKRSGCDTERQTRMMSAFARWLTSLPDTNCITWASCAVVTCRVRKTLIRLVKVGGSGLCHTDFTVISRDLSYWKDDPPPFTLGHQIAGWVEEVGAGVKNFNRGDAVALNPSWASCGRCHMCRSEEENHCLYQTAIRAPGVGYYRGHIPEGAKASAA